MEQAWLDLFGISVVSNFQCMQCYLPSLSISPTHQEIQSNYYKKILVSFFTRFRGGRRDRREVV